MMKNPNLQAGTPQKSVQKTCATNKQKKIISQQERKAHTVYGFVPKRTNHLTNRPT